MSRINESNLTRYTQKVKGHIEQRISEVQEEIDQKINESATIEKIFGDDEIIFNCGSSTETVS